MKVFTVLLLIVTCFVTKSISVGDTYKAAVVEFSPDIETPQGLERISKNIKSYINFIEQAGIQYADIIVFPEDGITSWSGITHKNVDELSTEVPEANLEISPCHTENHNYSKYFVDLSCAAAQYKVYTVINLIEKQYDSDTNKTNYYNTNVVFNRNGAVIAKYRKINLFNEPVFLPGKKLVTFETDFGVTFGVFICFDIMFKYPALDVLANKSVTDVVYSTAWFSELPFYSALSIQHGYAKSIGINIMVSGMNNPSTQNGGSGIYLHNGKIAQIYISGIKGSKLLVADVPKVNTISAFDSCQAPQEESGRSLKLPGSSKGRLSDINNFVTSEENLVNYTFKSLHLDKDVISETICSGSDFCCSFDFAIKRNPDVAMNYVYKLLAYYGVSQVSVNRSLGLRNCALVACLNETESTCGRRYKEAPQGVTFESISVRGNFDARTTHPQPATLTHDLLPVTAYTYCKKEADGRRIEVAMNTFKKQDSLLTFGIHGRVYSNDDKPGGVINSASY